MFDRESIKALALLSVAVIILAMIAIVQGLGIASLVRLFSAPDPDEARPATVIMEVAHDSTVLVTCDVDGIEVVNATYSM